MTIAFFLGEGAVFCSHSAGNWNLQCLELALVHHIELPHPGSRFCQDNGPHTLVPLNVSFTFDTCALSPADAAVFC